MLGLALAGFFFFFFVVVVAESAPFDLFTASDALVSIVVAFRLVGAEPEENDSGCLAEVDDSDCPADAAS